MRLIKYAGCWLLGQICKEADHQHIGKPYDPREQGTSPKFYRQGFNGKGEKGREKGALETHLIDGRMVIEYFWLKHRPGEMYKANVSRRIFCLQTQIVSV